MVWKHLRLPKPTRRQYAIAHYLQHGPRRRMVMAFRGVGKSWVTSAYVLWLLYCNPDTKVLVVSASKTRADNFTTFCLQLINEMDLLAHLRPLPEQRCSKISFDVGPAGPDQQPSLVSLGITSAIAGNRADFIVPDDVEVLNNSATQSMREKLSEGIKEFDAVLKPGGHIAFLGTPQSGESVYNCLPDRGYDIRVWPARYPSERKRAFYGSRLAPDVLKDVFKDPLLVGKTTEPSRFSDIDLAQREASFGSAGFDLQFMLDTSGVDVDKYCLKMRDILFWCLSPDGAPEGLTWEPTDANRIHLAAACDGLAGDRPYWASRPTDAPIRKYHAIVMAIDPGGRGADETAWAITGCVGGRIYLLDIGAVQGYSEGALRTIAETAKTWKVNKVIVESNFGDGMFSQLLRPILTSTCDVPVGIEEVRHSQQKEKRICDTLEPLIAQRRLVIHSEVLTRDADLIRHYPLEGALYHSLFYQLTRITRQRGALRHDDRLDAVAMSCAYWINSMAQGVEDEVRKARSADKMAQVKLFIDKSNRSRGSPGRDTTWGGDYA